MTQPMEPLHPTRVKKFEDGEMTRFHKKLAVYSSGGPFLDGYILSLIGIAMVQITPYMKLSNSWQGLIGAAALIGIFIGGFAGGWASDRFGRQMLYTIDLLAIVFFSLFQFWVEGPWALFLLRLGVGIAIGADYPIATTLLTEFLPRRWRGPAISFLMIMWFVGAASAYLIGELIHQMDPTNGWRWMLASATLPAIIIVFLRHGTLESPRWLIQHGRVEEADAIMKKVYGPEASVDDIGEVRTEHESVLKVLTSRYLGRTLFVTGFWTCSIIPIFAVYAFGPKILGHLGLEGELANVGSAVINVLFLAGCVVSTLIINKLGRRQLVIHSFVWSAIALALLGFFPEAPAWIIMILFSWYALFIGGTQVLQFVYPNELFPTKIRGSAVGLASSLSRIGAAIGTYLVPLQLAYLGIGTTMLIAAGITVLGAVISVLWAPETRHLDLMEASSIV